MDGMGKGLSSFIYTLLIVHEAGGTGVYVRRYFCCIFSSLRAFFAVSLGKSHTGFVIEAHGLIVIKMLDVSIYYVRL